MAKDNELFEVLQAFKGALDYLMDKVDQLDKMYEDYRDQTDERVHKIESTLYDEIINPTKAYIDETNKNARFDDFNSKYGEKLGAFNKNLSAIDGEDVDLTKAAFDRYDSLPEEERPDADAYVESIISEVGSQIEAIKESLGLPEDAEVSVTQDENGETVVEADGEVVATENEEAIPEEAPVEENDTNIEDGSKEAEDEELEDNPDEVAAFEEELKNYK
jgi:hypothetical protein